MSKKKVYETNSFKAVQKEWYVKLEASGFEDIEKGELDTVIRPQIIKTQTNQSVGGLNYYEFCQTILRAFRFKKQIHRVIFSLHSEGLSERDICLEVKRLHQVNFSQQGVNLLIRRVKEQFLKGES